MVATNNFVPILLLFLVLALCCPPPRSSWIRHVAAFQGVLPTNRPVRTLPPAMRSAIPVATMAAFDVVTKNSRKSSTVGRYSLSRNTIYSTQYDTSRLMEIVSMVMQRFVLPAVSSLLQQGIPLNWEDFWQRSIATPRSTNRWPKFYNRTVPVANNQTLAQLLTAVIEELGPTYVKFGQALSSRSDIIPTPLANALARLQDGMAPSLDYATAQQILRRELLDTLPRRGDNCTTEQVEALVHNLSLEPVACASIGQVYQSILPGHGPVAVKIQRPGLRRLVERDTTMLLGIAYWIESLSIPTLQWPMMPVALDSRHSNRRHRRLVQARVVDGVREFMSRVVEELDYGNEASNMVKFAELYCHRRKDSGSRRAVRVVVPRVHLDYCTPNIIVMEWIHGTKLSDWTQDAITDTDASENLSLLKSASAATLSQLLDTGLLHADPHGGNLLKVPTTTTTTAHERKRRNGASNKMATTTTTTVVHRLGYLDFGILSTVPESVRDALVCAVSQLVFGRNVTAVVDLLGQLQLLDPQTARDPTQREALVTAMNGILSDVLHFPDQSDVDGSTSAVARRQKPTRRATSTPVPQLRFDRLLGGLTLLVTQFALQLPPYFLNNARALATLEGIIQKLDPKHNAMEAIYPFAVQRLFGNPSQSPIVEQTLLNLLRHPETGALSLSRLLRLLDDAAQVSGQSRRRVVWDILSTAGGRKLVGTFLTQFLRSRLAVVDHWCKTLLKRAGRRSNMLMYLRL
jgi:predicted unusual protein kinase regulating ubiquinone biosynthesis (AarF/ABC1/UbiB family)